EQYVGITDYPEVQATRMKAGINPFVDSVFAPETLFGYTALGTGGNIHHSRCERNRSWRCRQNLITFFIDTHGITWITCFKLIQLLIGGNHISPGNSIFLVTYAAQR